jgi:hypothetical protein
MAVSIVDHRDRPPAVQSREKNRRHVSGMNAHSLRIASQWGMFILLVCAVHH